jgi:hypothetical protein
MSHPNTRPSVQSRLTTKVSDDPPQVRPVADPILTGIVARLEAEVNQAGGGDLQSVPGHVQDATPVQAVYDPFSRYHNTQAQDGVGMASSNRIDTSTTTTCICNRPMQLVMCQHCGETFEGRVKMICPSHPSVTYLLDVVACRGCKMDNVEDLREFPITKGK